MTPEQNALLARLDGYKLTTHPLYQGIVIKLSKDEVDKLPDYDDERNLMPLAWKYGIDCDQELDGTWSAKAYLDKDNPMRGVIDIIDPSPKQAIQSALLAIAEEMFK